MSTLPKWDERFYSLAKNIASWSKDPNKQVGAILVSPSRRQFSPGYNGLPRGLDDNRNLTKEAKNKLSVHAEVNAILNCPFDTKGASLYITEAPCVHCACIIIQAQIDTVISAPPDPKSTWYQSQLDAQITLREAKVGIFYE